MAIHNFTRLFTEMILRKEKNGELDSQGKPIEIEEDFSQFEEGYKDLQEFMYDKDNISIFVKDFIADWQYRNKYFKNGPGEALEDCYFVLYDLKNKKLKGNNIPWIGYSLKQFLTNLDQPKVGQDLLQVSGINGEVKKYALYAKEGIYHYNFMMITPCLHKFILTMLNEEISEKEWIKFIEYYIENEKISLLTWEFED